MSNMDNIIELAKYANKQQLITEDFAALAFAERYRGELLYDHDAGCWFRWDGEHWQPERTKLAFAWARELVRALTEGEAVRAKALGRKTSFISGVERLAQADRTFAVTEKDWNCDPFLLATPGGTVDLKTGDLRPADPVDRINKITAVAPADIAECPRWLTFLDEATGGDTAMIAFLQRWFGYCLSGDTREHALLFVYGPGGNGKSVLVNTMAAILGDYAKVAPMESFTASKGDRHPADLAMLRGARLVTASETEQGRSWSETRIKQITGGDPITARFMHCNFFTYLPQFKLAVIGNYEPNLRSVDDASRRRINIAPFIRKPAVVDKMLMKKLRAEWPGILRWTIQGCLAWQADGLMPPPAVQAATASYFDNQDMFSQWLEERCVTEPGNKNKTDTSANLFASWAAFAKAAGEVSGSRKSFAKLLEQRGFEQYRKGDKMRTRAWWGLYVRPDGYGWPEPDERG
jgi:putative DNA primase/helicase